MNDFYHGKNFNDVIIPYEKYDSQKEVLELTKCPICLEILKTPLGLKCGHYICQLCFVRSKEISKEFSKCPICRSELLILKKTSILFIQSILDTLIIRCFSDKCNWKGNKFELEKHFKSNCNYIYLCECQNVYHITEPRKGYIHYTYLITKKLEFIKLHSDHCLETLVTCLCLASVKKKNLEEHERLHCVLNSVICPCSKWGCLWEGRKHNLIEHNKECLFNKAYEDYNQIISNNNENHHKHIENNDISNKIIEIYKSSELFKIMGLSNIKKYPENYQERVLSILKTEDDLTLYGFKAIVKTEDKVKLKKYTTTDEISILIPSNNSEYICIYENRELGILCVPVSNLYRFFIIPCKYSHNVSVTRKGGALTIDFSFTSGNILGKILMPVFIASRKWSSMTTSNQNIQIPYYCELNNTFIKNIIFEATNPKRNVSEKKENRKLKKQKIESIDISFLPSIDNDNGHKESNITLDNKAMIEYDERVINQPFDCNNLFDIFKKFFISWSNLK